MPNWVINKIETEPEVIRAMVDADGRVDFALIKPFEGEFPWDSISVEAETLAEAALCRPLHENGLIAHLESHARARANAARLSDDNFEQFVQMLRNYRRCGFLHQLDFARTSWGSKWNACESLASVEAGTASFKTAWSCPTSVLAELSKRFPNFDLAITYADEDTGSNCGTFTLRGGEVVQSNIAPDWSGMSEADRARWTHFALDVWGKTSEMEDE